MAPYRVRRAGRASGRRPPAIELALLQDILASARIPTVTGGYERVQYCPCAAPYSAR